MCLRIPKLKEKYEEKKIFFASLKSLKKEVGSGVGTGSGSAIQRCGSPTPHRGLPGFLSRLKYNYHTSYHTGTVLYGLSLVQGTVPTVPVPLALTLTLHKNYTVYGSHVAIVQ